MKIVFIILGIGALVGAVWFFSKSSTDTKTTETKSSTTSNSGLSGLLSGVNLSGLNIF